MSEKDASAPLQPAASPKPLELEAIGDKRNTIPVELSTRFLEHFSQRLYSSPQKAFEELISNGWDAGTTCVDVRIFGKLTGCRCDDVRLRQWRFDEC
jgi:hypothetical protein